MKELYALSYSKSQKCYHIDYLQSELEANLRSCLGGINSDFLLIHVAETWEECSDVSENLESQGLSGDGVILNKENN